MSRVYLSVAGILVSTVAAAYAAPHIVSQKGKLFSPGALTVKSGETLLFQNDDRVSHHVYSSTKGQDFNLDTLPPGESASRAFSKKGRIDVRCGLHPGMRLIVTVE